MAIEPIFDWESGFSGIPVTVAGAVYYFHPTRQAQKRWVAETSPSDALGKTFAVLYECRLADMYWGQHPFPVPPPDRLTYVLVTHDQLSGQTIGRHATAEEAAAFLKAVRRQIRLEDFAGRLPAQLYALLAYLWKSRGHKASFDTLVKNVWSDNPIEPATVGQTARRLSERLCKLGENRVVVSVKDSQVILKLPYK